LADIPLPTLGEAGTEAGGDWAQNIIDSLRILNESKPDTAALTDLVTPEGSDGLVVSVSHGSDPNVARPAAAKVVWDGDVRPLNMTDDDLWVGLPGSTAAANAPYVVMAITMNTWPSISTIPAGFAGLVMFVSVNFPGCSAPPMWPGAIWLRRNAA
jgi:hypothetical protein